ncbi:Fc.00g029610.m01.CDS01 [Cosmosporella sp. VM-42]
MKSSPDYSSSSLGNHTPSDNCSSPRRIKQDDLARETYIVTHQKLLTQAQWDLYDALNRIAQLKEGRKHHLDPVLKTRGRPRRRQPLNEPEEAQRRESENMAAEMHHMEALGWSTFEVAPELKLVLGFNGFGGHVLATPGGSTGS